MTIKARLERLEAAISPPTPAGPPFDWSLVSESCRQDVAQHTSDLGVCDYSKLSINSLRELLGALKQTEEDEKR